MTADVRIAFRPDTPPAWKGSAVVTSANVPASVGLGNANVIPLFGANATEQRERRLILGITVPSLVAGPGFASASRLRCGHYYFSAGAGVSEGGSFGSIGGTANANIGLRITVQGYVRQVLQCDFAPGIFRVPPSTDVKVEAIVSRVALGGAFNTLQLFAELVDSCEGPVSRPIESALYSVPVNTVPGDGQISVYLNPYARWFDIQASATFGLATSPVITADGFYGPSIKRDYINNTWFPTGEPVDLGGATASTNTTDRPYYRVTNESTLAKTIVVSQFLEW